MVLITVSYDELNSYLEDYLNDDLSDVPQFIQEFINRFQVQFDEDMDIQINGNESTFILAEPCTQLEEELIAVSNDGEAWFQLTETQVDIVLDRRD